tara:strand:- start:512 stop:736 length:225 start_codon:yes stop_codon:yes gene_type:complete
MAMTREERVAIHKKLESRVVVEGEPDITELPEGVPVIRATDEGVVQFVRYNNEIYKNIFTSSEGVGGHKTWDKV